MNAALPGRRIVMAGLFATVALSIVPAAPALAAEVNFDPDSPAGKEYALPLPEARNEALGDEGIDDRPPSQATLFGVGIGGSGGSGGASQGNRAPPSSGQGEGGGGKTDSSGEPQGPASKPSLANQDSSYSLGTAIALVGAILLIALALGIALRAQVRIAAGRPGSA